MTTRMSGLWLPLITPFQDGAVDFTSYERLIEHFIGQGVDALFPLGTTGESPALDEAEVDALVERTVAVAAGRVPVFVGIGGNATHKVEKTMRRLEPSSPSAPPTRSSTRASNPSTRATRATRATQQRTHDRETIRPSR